MNNYGQKCLEDARKCNKLVPATLTPGSFASGIAVGAAKCHVGYNMCLDKHKTNNYGVHRSDFSSMFNTNNYSAFMNPYNYL